LKVAALVRAPVEIVACTFSGVAYGVHSFISGTWGLIEGPPPHGIQVRDCRFEKTSLAGISVSLPSREAVPPSPFALKVENCEFNLGDGPGWPDFRGTRDAIAAQRLSGVVLRDLRLVTADDRRADDLIRIEDCEDVQKGTIVVESRPTHRDIQK
ncbi:hypothetical protein HQ520_00485, partial [bacterium]|nr:hypothetical protein [bacterium]